MKPAVMRAACAAGAEMINDVWRCARPARMEAARDIGLRICLMHMQGEPRTMQRDPHYDDVVAEVQEFLLERVAACHGCRHRQGPARRRPRVWLRQEPRAQPRAAGGLDVLGAAGLPVMVGLSRKSMFKALLGRELEERLPAQLAAATIAVRHGASIVRTHDVAATRDAIRRRARSAPSRQGVLG